MSVRLDHYQEGRPKNQGPVGQNLTTLFVNLSLKLQNLISEICQCFLLKYM